MYIYPLNHPHDNIIHLIEKCVVFGDVGGVSGGVRVRG